MQSKQPNILLVEDEPTHYEPLSKFLTQDGYKVEVATRGDDALRKLDVLKPDLIILDILLPSPGPDGIGILRSIRQGLKLSIPIIMLTVKDDPNSKIVAHDQDADEYIPKPYNYNELEACIRKLLRRHHPETKQSFCWKSGALLFDPDKSQISLGVERKNLTRAEYVCLKYLIENSKRIVSRAKLREVIYGDSSEVNDVALTNVIHRLRKKLEADPSEPAFIDAEIGLGYKFVGEVEKVECNEDG